MPIAKSLPGLVCFAISLLGAPTVKGETVSAIGAHQPILVVNKNVNPRNQLVVYTKQAVDGSFLMNPADRNRPLLDFYWLMDGRNYKPVNGLIKSEIRRRFACQSLPGASASHFTIEIRDLKEVNADLRDPKVDVYARRTRGISDVEAQISLGPSDGYMRIKLSSIYTEGATFPPAVHAVTLKGEEIVNGKLTGKKVTRRYDAKSRSND